MNKLFAAFLVLVFSFGLVGCEKSDAQKEKEQKGSMGKTHKLPNWYVLFNHSNSRSHYEPANHPNRRA